jgi:hypothetical protein
VEIREVEEKEVVAAHLLDKATEELADGVVVVVVGFEVWPGIDEVEGAEEAGSAQRIEELEGRVQHQRLDQ